MMACFNVFSRCVLVFMGVIIPRILSFRETETSAAMTTGDLPGEPLSNLFTEGTDAHEAIVRNMFAVTGGSASSKPQSLAYRYMEEGKGAAFNKDLKIEVYYCKADVQEPGDGTYPTPGKWGSAQYVTTTGNNPHKFTTPALESFGLDINFDKLDDTRKTGQPLVAVVGSDITKYTGEALEQTEHCYMIAIHNHVLRWKLSLSFPLEVQVLGTLNKDWFDTDQTAPPAEDSLCGVCIKTEYKTSFMSYVPDKTQAGVCATQRENQPPVSRSL